MAHQGNDEESGGGARGAPAFAAGIRGGTHLFTISEEAEMDMDGGAADPERNQQHSQNSSTDGVFIKPGPIRKGMPKPFQQFFKKIDFGYKPMETISGQKIRFVHEATMPSSLSRREEVRRVQRQQFVERTIK